MMDLLILDLVLLVGLTVLPRHVKRSYLAIRRLAKEGLREATSHEPVSAVEVAARYGIRAVRAGRSRLSFETVRPALLPTAAALAATALVAGYATWTTPSAGEGTGNAAAVIPEPPVQWLEAADPMDEPPGEETAAPEVRIACSETAAREEVLLLLDRVLDAGGEVRQEYRATLRRSTADAVLQALEAIPEATSLRYVRIL